MLVKYIMNVFKKLFEGRKLNCNEVVKEVSNGKYKKLDTYLEEMNNKVTDLAGIKGKVLWTNSNPSAKIGSTTVTLNDDISNYDEIGIYYYTFIEGETMGYVRGILDKFSEIFLDSTFFYQQDIYTGTRSLSRFSGKTCYIGDAYAMIEASGITKRLSNDWIIPLYIVGYKTNLF